MKAYLAGFESTIRTLRALRCRSHYLPNAGTCAVHCRNTLRRPWSSARRPSHRVCDNLPLYEHRHRARRDDEPGVAPTHPNHFLSDNVIRFAGKPRRYWLPDPSRRLYRYSSDTEHRLTHPYQPRTEGQAARAFCTLEEGNARTYRYEAHRSKEDK